MSLPTIKSAAAKVPAREMAVDGPTLLTSTKFDFNLTPSFAALTDPILQDLSHKSRRYLAHFADRVCGDVMVAGGVLDIHPFQELIPLAIKHEFLFHIIIATSALHWSNSCRPRISTVVPALLPTALTAAGSSLIQSADIVEYEPGHPWSQPLIDALSSKQQAITSMRNAITDRSLRKSSENADVLLAAVLFFIDFDLIDVGTQAWKSGWKAHLDGATKLLEVFCPNEDLGPLPLVLRDAVVSELFIYHILGTTLTATGLTPRVDGYILNLWPLLQKAESNSYLLCPQRILWTILSASHLAYHMSHSAGMAQQDLDHARRLLQQALTFDIPSWSAGYKELLTKANRNSSKTLNFHLEKHLEAKKHVASAHRSAGCLYIMHVIPSLALEDSSFSVSVDDLVADAIHHLSSIDKSDPHFKGTTWPTFMAGLHVRDKARRQWVRNHLDSVWEICPWGYILTAKQLLEDSWKYLDEAVEELGSWGALQKLRAKNFECLVV